MTTQRLVATTTLTAVLAWFAVGLEGLMLLFTALSAWCSDGDTGAECAEKGQGAEGVMVLGTIIIAGIAIMLLAMAIQAVARPRLNRFRWCAAAGAGMLAMPLAVIAAGFTVFAATSHSGGDTTPAWMAAVGVQLAWPYLWALGFRQIAEREHRLHP
jgi:hypothetical protein